MIARPPITPPTMAPTGVEVEVEVDVIWELDAVPEAAFAVGAGAVDVVCAKLEVDVANVLVGVEDGAAVVEGGIWVPVERLR